jgi:hypothetical protein
MAPTERIRLVDGIPVGTMYITGGPGKYEFFRQGVEDACSEPHGLDFKLEVHYEVRMRIRGVRQMPSWQCPRLPPDLSTGSDERDWRDAWEFTGCVPGYGIGALGIYDVHTRKGIAHLWQASMDDYGCAGARRDLHTFFATMSGRAAMLALERAMSHMTRGSSVGCYHIDCRECWELFRELRRSCDLP